jgi:large subunit ribosomal protein L19
MSIAPLIQSKTKTKIPTLAPGDTVRVHVKVVEGEKERIQVFQGTIIGVQSGATGNFTVRRVAYGTGVERTFPVNSPLVDKVEVIRHGKVRRAKLYYLRGLTTKKSRLKEKRDLLKPEDMPVEAAATAEPITAAPEAAVAVETTKPEAKAEQTPPQA